MSIRPSDFKETMYAPTEESSMSESEIKKQEVKRNFRFVILFLVIDYVMTVCVIVDESNIFGKKKVSYDSVPYLIGCIAGLTVFFIFIIISLLFYRVGLAKVIKYIYLGICGAYFILLLVMKIMYFVNHFDDLTFLDILFLLILVLTIIPKIFFFCYIGNYIIRLVEKYEAQKGEEHEDFRNNLENKMERGDATNWSKTSLPNQPFRPSS